MLSFLKSSGFSNAQLQKILKYRHRFLHYSLECNIKPKIKRLQDEGFSPNDISKIISTFPHILKSSLKNSIMPSVSELKALLGSNTAVVKVARRSLRNSEKSLVANVEFLKSCGISVHRIRIILTDNPDAFCHGSQAMIMRGSVEKTKEMRIIVASNAFIYAIETITSMSPKGWELKSQAFRDMGFSNHDRLIMFRKEPQLFIVSSEKMKKITECLVATEKFDISAIAVVDYPTSLMYSFEKRYKLQITTLRTLESWHLNDNWPTAYASEAKFSERFVPPYINAVGDICMEGGKIKQALGAAAYLWNAFGWPFSETWAVSNAFIYPIAILSNGA